MARGMPSMVALLGLLAVAGYQNRDKLGGLLNGMGGMNATKGHLTGRCVKSAIRTRRSPISPSAYCTF